MKLRLSWEAGDSPMVFEDSLSQATALLFQDSNTIIFPGIEVFPNEFELDVDNGEEDDDRHKKKRITPSPKVRTPASTILPAPGLHAFQKIVALPVPARRPDKKDLPLALAKLSPAPEEYQDKKSKIINKQIATKKTVVGVPVKELSVRKKQRQRPVLKRTGTVGVSVKQSRNKKRQKTRLLPKLTKTPKDIVAGRGGESNNHGPGNDFFWGLVLLHRPLYRQCKKTDIKKKQAIANNCWEMAHVGGRRFLGRKKGTKELMELSKEQSMEKCKQALRGSDKKAPKSLLDPRTCQPLPLTVLRKRFEEATIQDKIPLKNSKMLFGGLNLVGVLKLVQP
eukprot:Nitzschia sp. Nitz4//scaffold16_size188269//128185//129195//NITZ4_001805-RA/size188269-processed-gene-0.63-mRNA-1//1//CDS//3329538559//2932//frame0